MATAPRVAGTCFFKVDGEQLDLKGKVECPMSNKNRSPVMGTTGLVGYKEEARTPFLKGTFIVPPKFPRKKLDESTDMTITVELANGEVYTLSGAFVVGEPSYDSDEGTAEYEFNGVSWIWQ